MAYEIEKTDDEWRQELSPEEYAVQRYEGASTLYGQYTLDAYIHATLDSLHHLLPNAPVPPSSPPADEPRPPIIAPDKAIMLNTGVVYDNPAIGKSFGQVLTQPKSSYTLTQRPMVEAVFVAANPRNNLRLEGNFAVVEKASGSGAWVRYRGDDDWDLTFHWTRKDGLLGSSEVKVRWEVKEDVEKGKYRVVYYGDAKRPVTGKIVEFTGTSAEFQIV